MRTRRREKAAENASATNLAPVLVGIDDSETSQLALAWAIDEAVRRSSPLELVHVLQPAPSMQPDRCGCPRPSTRARPLAECVLATSIGKARAAAPDLHIEGDLVMGVANQVLLEVASHAQLLVIGSRGLGQVRGKLLDSVGLHAIAQATCPVVVVRAEAHADGAVIAAVDGSHLSQCTLAQAIEEASLRDCPLRVIWAVGRQGDAVRRDVQLAGLSRRREVILTSMLAELSQRARGLHVDASFPVGSPTDVLIAASATSRLVVLGSHGASRFTGFRLGSVAHAVAARGRCPVMVVPASGNR